MMSRMQGKEEDQAEVTPPHADDYISPAPRVSVQAFCVQSATATAARAGEM
jgi:pilus assembly protein CpaE